MAGIHCHDIVLDDCFVTGYTKDDSEDIFAVVDGDNSGLITVLEFMKWYTRLCEKAEAAAAQLADQMDDDDDVGGSQSDDDEDNDIINEISPSDISAKRTVERNQLLSSISQQLCCYDPHWHIPPRLT